MENEQMPHVTHILVMPYPAQGHINPMLQFSKRLASKALKVTLITFTDKELIKGEESGSVTIETFFESTQEESNTMSVEEYLLNFQALVSRNIQKFVAKQGMSGYPISCLIYDSMMPWALDLARQLGIMAGPFFTQPWAVNSIYYKVHEGQLNIPIEEETSVYVEGMPPLEVHDLPSFVYDDKMYPGLLRLMMTPQFSNIGEVDWIFINTYYSLEEEALNWMANQYPIKPIGPSIPLKYLDNRLEEDKNYGVNLFKPNTNNCLQWLDSKKSGSVVYVSFGSFSALEGKQMEELAYALKSSNYYFLWVVRETEEQKLPRNFLEEASEKGLIVAWCPQMEVLAHKSIGCFLTHCGWNSTLEALSLGVPMVAMPQFADQPTNAKLVADMWQVGVRVTVDSNGLVTKREIESCVKEMMEGKRAFEFRRNAEKWKELAKEAVNEGGSSDKNFQEFVLKLASKSNIVMG